LRDEVVGADLLAEDRRNALDDAVAHRVAERVVVPLEPGDVDEAHGAPARALLEREERLELLDEPVEVHELRLRVAPRLVGQLADEPLEVVRDVRDRLVALDERVPQLLHPRREALHHRLDRIVLGLLPEALLARDDGVDRRVEVGFL
jgi:hypothetical protein